MQEMRRAPELSATSSSVLIWIMAPSYPCAASPVPETTISSTRQRLFLDSGRVSTMRTVSPCFAPFSSWAMKVEVRLMVLRYIACWTRRSTATTTVFCILAFTTTPTSSLRRRSGALLVFSPVIPLPLRRLGRGQLLDHRLDPRDVAARLADLEGVVQLPQRLLEAQAEQLLLQLALLAAQLVRVHLAELLRFA